MRILGLDVGERRIGVAVSDALGLTAQRLSVLERRAPAADLDAIAELVAAQQASAVVVGLPLTLKGEHSAQTTRVAAFIEELRGHLSCPVHPVDERLTTVQAQRDRKSTRLNSSHGTLSRMPSSA